MDFTNSLSVSKVIPSQILPSQLAGDISFVLVFIAISLVAGMYLGRTQLVAVLMFEYIATALMTVLPSSLFAAMPLGRAGVFLAIFLLIFIVGDYVLDIHISSSGSDFLSRVLIMSFLATGMLVSIVFSFLPTSELTRFLSMSSLDYFISPTAQMAWMIVPLVFLLFVNKRLR